MRLLRGSQNCTMKMRSIQFKTLPCASSNKQFKKQSASWYVTVICVHVGDVSLGRRFFKPIVPCAEFRVFLKYYWQGYVRVPNAERKSNTRNENSFKSTVGYLSGRLIERHPDCQPILILRLHWFRHLFLFGRWVQFASAYVTHGKANWLKLFSMMTSPYLRSWLISSLKESESELWSRVTSQVKVRE